MNRVNMSGVLIFFTVAITAVQGQKSVCENCVELDAVTGAIVGDLLVTGGVIFIVYSWAQKKSGPAAPQKQTYRSAGRGPPVVPSPDYEPLSVATCSRDIYATHRTG
ncbi:T-cell surface glycoprotein CD3 epsilon chain-like [Oncorhynchus masou masou]|uniref:T-cell surface glycoprotein CD3 epsilon chain-like n=1 Tax=Oncorhynchus masou masou TaxID=90313 RepID=UPI0031840896